MMSDLGFSVQTALLTVAWRCGRVLWRRGRSLGWGSWGVCNQLSKMWHHLVVYSQRGEVGLYLGLVGE